MNAQLAKNRVRRPRNKHDGICHTRRGTAAGKLSDPSDPTDRALHARGDGGHRRPQARPKLSEGWSQQVVVDNRAGAGGTIGVRHRRQGRTRWLHAPRALTGLRHERGALRQAAVRSVKDFAPISQISIGPSIVVVAPSLGVKSVRELIALARSKPGQINFASAGIGSGTHLNGEQFKHAAAHRSRARTLQGPNEALLDVATGRIQYFISPLVPALPFIRDGSLIPLGVTTAQRARALPDVPTVAESALPGYEYQAWFGAFAPAGTPRAVVDRIGQGNRARRGPPRCREAVPGSGRRSPGQHAGGIRRFRPRRDREIPEGRAARQYPRRLEAVSSTLQRTGGSRIFC